MCAQGAGGAQGTWVPVPGHLLQGLPQERIHWLVCVHNRNAHINQPTYTLHTVRYPSPYSERFNPVGWCPWRGQLSRHPPRPRVPRAGPGAGLGGGTRQLCRAARARARVSLATILHAGPAAGTRPRNLTPKCLNVFSRRWEKARPHCSSATASLRLAAALFT